MEVAGALELQKGGHFRYALSYGAVDEEAEGDWTFDGTRLRLTSRPMPKAPRFELVRDDPAPKGQLFLRLEDPGFEWGHPLEAVARSTSSDGFEISADESGRVDLSERPPVTAVAPEMPVYGPTGDIFPISQDRGHRLTFRFHRNDLGKARFAGEPLAASGSGFVLQRYDVAIRFVRVAP